METILCTGSRFRASLNENTADESLLEGEGANLRALWRSVITQALMDAGRNSNKKSEQIHKKAALKWLEEESEDFMQVCILADMDPMYVRAQAAEAVSRGCKWRNDARQAVAVKMNLAEEFDRMEHEDLGLDFDDYFGSEMLHRDIALTQSMDFKLDNRIG